MNICDVSLADWAGPLFEPHRFKVLYGGRSSGKTEQVAAALVIQGHEQPLTMAIVREHLESINKSAKPALEQWIRRLGMERPDAYKITQNEIRHKNGTWMFFAGMSKVSEEDIKGWHRVNRAWVEEAHMMSQRSRNLLYPTVMRVDDSEAWLTFNPRNRNDPVYKDFVDGKWMADQSYVRKVNYYDNPWFPEGEEMLRQEWETFDPNTYAHVWLGEPDDNDAGRQILPHVVLRECVAAYREGLHEKADLTPVDMGMDIAEGGADKCAQIIRRGPVVDFVDVWPGVPGDLSVAARHAHTNVVDNEYELWRIYYDASSPMYREFRDLDFGNAGVREVHFGGKVKGPERLYERRSTNNDVFARRNIQMADDVRLRANRTVRLRKGDEGIDPNKCLFIRNDLPDLQGLLSDLTQPVRRQNPTNGKWEVDKTGGEVNAKSPDRYDALVLAFSRGSERGLRAR